MATPSSGASRARSAAVTAVACLVLVTVGGLLGALALEIGVRVALPMSDFFYEFDPHVGLKGVPNKHGRAIKRGVFDTDVTLNSHGFRDGEHAYAKARGTRRIVLLGDSFIEALQVPFERSVTPLLEAKIRQQKGDVELINLGLSGFGTAREYLMLKEYGLRYQPDLVVMFFVGNDISDNSRRLHGKPFLPYPVPAPDGGVARDERGEPRFSAFSDTTSRLDPMVSYLRMHSKAYRALREAIDSSPSLNGLLYRVGVMSNPPEQVNRVSATNFGFHEIYRVNPTPVWVEAWSLTEGMLVATRDLAASRGARFAVVIVPAAWEVYPDVWEQIKTTVPGMAEVPMDLALPARRLAKFLTGHDIPFVTLLDDFRARAGTSPALYLAGDAHWSEAGHRLASELLADRVAGLIPSARVAAAHASGAGVAPSP